MGKIYRNRWLGYLLLFILLFCAGCGNQKLPDSQADVPVKDEQITEEVKTENETVQKVLPEETLEEETSEESDEIASEEREKETTVEDTQEEQEGISGTQNSDEEEESDSQGVIFEKPEKNDQGTVAPRLDFPIEIEGGKLMIESVFQYSGINVDANDEICEDIGAVQLKNTSAEYLERADVVVELSEGDKLSFVIEDLPAGEAVIAFEKDNKVYDVSQSVEKMTAKPVWGKGTSLLENKVNVTTDGIKLNVKNNSSSTLKNLKVVYHCELDGVFFGGKSYEGIIENLGTGKSTVMDASECYLGEAVVVRVSE